MAAKPKRALRDRKPMIRLPFAPPAKVQGGKKGEKGYRRPQASRLIRKELLKD